MNKWIKKFDDVMAAAAYAEEGEFKTARETLKERRTILLALKGDGEDQRAFRYALKACQRVKADLEILFSGQKKEIVTERMRSELELEGISCSFTRAEGCVREAVQKHTRRRSDILFVVVESSDTLSIDCRKSQKSISRSWKDLTCPLVVVGELAVT